MTKLLLANEVIEVKETYNEVMKAIDENHMFIQLEQCGNSYYGDIVPHEPMTVSVNRNHIIKIAE